MSRTLPLVSARAPHDTLAWTVRGPISVVRYCADVRRLAGWLPPGRFIINLCEDRYRYAVLLGACAMSGRVSLQPSSQSPQVFAQLLQTYEGCRAVGDAQPAQVLPLQVLRLPPLGLDEAERHRRDDDAIPAVPIDRTVAILFTSGSTGQPTPHAKTWGKLVASGQAEARALGLDARPHALVGTVPAQHSYGFESTVLLALHGGCSFWSGRPFYPQDLAQALAAVPRPRMVVTTPFHLRSFISSGVSLPTVDLWLSATAPLDDVLAAQVEAATGAPVHEIYGSTESSQLATRRTLDGAAWHPMPGVRLEQDEGGTTWALGDHVEGRVPLSDIIALHEGGRFTLQGRQADMVNLAGKRTSLAYLNHVLCGIDGVRDGAFFLPSEDTAQRVGRLAAFVVAPGHDQATLLAALRQRIDPIFLPRPLVLVDALARNDASKVVREQLQRLYDDWAAAHGRGDAR